MPIFLLCSMLWLRCTMIIGLMVVAMWLQAEARQLPAAETNCRAALKASGGCHPPSWALLALILSARQHIAAALAVASAALEEAGPSYEGLLLKIKVWPLALCITQSQICSCLLTSQSNRPPATLKVSLHAARRELSAHFCDHFSRTAHMQALGALHHKSQGMQQRHHKCIGGRAVMQPWCVCLGTSRQTYSSEPG